MGQSYVYLLELADGCYYIGWTEDLYKRIGQHFLGLGSQWTQTHKPVSVCFVWEGANKTAETRITKMIMKKYGIDKVRGSAWCSVNGNFKYAPNLDNIEVVEYEQVEI